MKRPKQQIIDDAGERQMRSIFERLGWAVRKLDKDNGIDFDIEIFDNFKSTGVFFKVQLKSSERTRYSASKDFISQQVEIPNAQYLCQEVRLPVVLIHADVKNERTFWCAPQLMSHELERLINKKSHKSISLRIPTHNELPVTITKLVETITQVEQVLASKLFISTPASNFVDSIHQHVDEDQLSYELQNKADAIKINQSQQLIQSYRFSEAIDKAQRVFTNSESSVVSKFVSLIQIEKAELMAAMNSQAPQENHHLIKLKVGRQFRELTKKGPRPLKLYAMIAWETAKLERLTHKYHGLLLNWTAHREGNNAIWKAQLIFERTKVYRQILLKYNQCIKLANYAARLRDRRYIPFALMRIVDAIARLIGNLTSEKLNDLADKYSASALQICKLAEWMAANDNDDEALFTVAIKALSTKYAPTGDAVDFALATIDKIKDEKTKRKTQELFDLYIGRFEGKRIDSPIKTTYRQIYENMAASLGIDLDDANNPISELVQIGIQDIDPSRILVNCEHIFTTLVARGFTEQYVSEIFQLPTASSKVIHCDLHECATVGLTLDGAYEHFRKRYCDKCSDCSPRSSDWQYSEGWQQEENKKHVEYMKRFARQTGISWPDNE